MIPDAQREALAALAEVWALSPDVRLGQLLAHLGFLGEAHLGRGMGYLEDDELMAVLYRHRAESKAQLIRRRIGPRPPYRFPEVQRLDCSLHLAGRESPMLVADVSTRLRPANLRSGRRHPRKPAVVILI